MASGSQLEAETDTDIVVLSSTESTSATRQLPSLLDKLCVNYNFVPNFILTFVRVIMPQYAIMLNYAQV